MAANRQTSSTQTVSGGVHGGGPQRLEIAQKCGPMRTEHSSFFHHCQLYMLAFHQHLARDGVCGVCAEELLHNSDRKLQRRAWAL